MDAKSKIFWSIVHLVCLAPLAGPLAGQERHGGGGYGRGGHGGGGYGGGGHGQSHGHSQPGRHPGPGHGYGGWHGDIHRFPQHDLGRWHGGHWYHGAHGGHSGWWWIVGPTWYYYPSPIYPYPDPYLPPVVGLAPLPAPGAPPYWYYCGDPPGYYPYVPQCRVGWVAVPAR